MVSRWPDAPTNNQAQGTDLCRAPTQYTVANWKRKKGQRKYVLLSAVGILCRGQCWKTPYVRMYVTMVFQILRHRSSRDLLLCWVHKVYDCHGKSLVHSSIKGPVRNQIIWRSKSWFWPCMLSPCLLSWRIVDRFKPLLIRYTCEFRNIEKSHRDLFLKYSRHPAATYYPREPSSASSTKIGRRI